MSKLVTILTIAAHHLVAAKLVGKLDADAASWCLESCEKAQAVDAFGAKASISKASLLKSEAQNTQKDVFASTCGPPTETTLEGLIEKAAEMIKNLPKSQKLQKKLMRRAVRKVAILESKIHSQTQAILSKIADVKSQVATPAVEVSGRQISGSQIAARSLPSTKNIADMVAGVTSKDYGSFKALKTDFKSVFLPLHALKMVSKSSTFAKLMTIVAIIQADESAISLCHAKALMALTLHSFVDEWEEFLSEVKFTESISYQQGLEICEFYVQATRLMDIDLAKYFEADDSAEKLMF